MSCNGGNNVSEVGEVCCFVEDGVEVYFEVSDEFPEVVRFEGPIHVVAP